MTKTVTSPGAGTSQRTTGNVAKRYQAGVPATSPRTPT